MALIHYVELLRIEQWLKMECKNFDTLDNYDDACIANIRAAWDEERASGTSKPVYVMCESCTPCEVEITKESMQTCAEALLNWQILYIVYRCCLFLVILIDTIQYFKCYGKIPSTDTLVELLESGRYKQLVECDDDDLIALPEDLDQLFADIGRNMSRSDAFDYFIRRIEK